MRWDFSVEKDKKIKRQEQHSISWFLSVRSVRELYNNVVTIFTEATSSYLFTTGSHWTREDFMICRHRPSNQRRKIMWQELHRIAQRNKINTFVSWLLKHRDLWTNVSQYFFPEAGKFVNSSYVSQDSEERIRGMGSKCYLSLWFTHSSKIYWNLLYIKLNWRCSIKGKKVSLM